MMQLIVRRTVWTATSGYARDIGPHITSFKAPETLGFEDFAIWPPVFTGALAKFVFCAERWLEASSLRDSAIA